MEENKRSVIMPSLMNGIYLGLALIIFSLLLFIGDVDQESKITWLSYLIMAGGLYYAMVSYRDKYAGGFLSYGQAFGAGFWTGLFASILAAIFTYFYFAEINPGLVDEIITKAEESILAGNPDISDEDLDRALSMTARFTTPAMLTVWSFIANVILATILSLIIAIFARRERNPVA